jgi:hypothetical protein
MFLIMYLCVYVEDLDSHLHLDPCIHTKRSPPRRQDKVCNLPRKFPRSSQGTGSLADGVHGKQEVVIFRGGIMWRLCDGVQARNHGETGTHPSV